MTKRTKNAQGIDSASGGKRESMARESRTCPECLGTGDTPFIDAFSVPCFRCNGSGELPAEPCANAAPSGVSNAGENETADEKVCRLASRVEELEKEVEHWKANAAEQVRRKRVTGSKLREVLDVCKTKKP